MTTAAVDLASATRGWSPAPESTTGTTTAWAVAALSGLFDLDPVARDGDPCPDVALGRVPRPPRHDELGDDGHPAAGHFLPPIPDRRRMIAGGRLEVRTPMRVSEILERRTSLTRREVKHGRSGAMLLVTLRHEFLRGRQIVTAEEQDVVYRSQPPGRARGSTRPTSPPRHRRRAPRPSS